MMVEPLTVYIGIAIFGVFTGLGNAIGQYLFKHHLLKKYNQLKKKYLALIKTVKKQGRGVL